NSYLEFPASTNSHLLTSYDRNARYECKVYYFCRPQNRWVEGSLGYFYIQQNTVQGTGDCFPPQEITHEVSNSLTADISWPKDKDSKGYWLYYRYSDELTWDSSYTGSSSTTLKKLTFNKELECYVKAVCKDSRLSIASDKYRFLIRSTGKSNCPALELNEAQILNENQVKITWKFPAIAIDAPLPYTGYLLEYKEETAKNWIGISTQDTFVLLENMDPQKKYFVRISGNCADDRSNTSDELPFTTYSAQNKNFVCGSRSNAPVIQNRKSITLAPGDKFTAANFELTVKSLESQEPYNGIVVASIPYLKHSTLQFRMKQVRVNELRQLYEGKIYVIGSHLTILDTAMARQIDEMLERVDEQFTNVEEYLTKVAEYQDNINDYIEKNEGGNNVGFVKSGQVEVNSKISIAVNNASQFKSVPNSKGECVVEITGNDGSKQTQTFTPPATVESANGNLFYIDISCKVVKAGERIVIKQTTQELDKLSKKGTVTFSKSNESPLGFSAWNSAYEISDDWNKRYQKLGDYRVASKFMEPGRRDPIKGTLIINDNTINKSKIIFATGKGVKYEASNSGNEYSIHVLSGPEGDAQELYALYPKDSAGMYESLGKILIPTYKHKQRKLVLIPVNGATTNANSIKNTLNTIYQPYGVDWSVETAANFTDLSWNLNNDKDNALDIEGSGAFSTLTNEMKALNAAWIKRNKPDPSVIYLFVLKKAETPNVAGDMPRSKQFGYLFTDGQPSDQQGLTAAHEVAHGLFLLRHISDGYGLTENSVPDNLMDKAKGKQLEKIQWDVMHDPGIVLGVFEKDEDGQLASVGIAELKSLSNPDGSFTFVAPSGKLITLPSTIKSVTFSTADNWMKSEKIMPMGTLTSFTNSEGVYYAVGDEKSFDFQHFAAGKTTIYTDQLSKKQNFFTLAPILGMPCLDGDVIQFRVFKSNFKNATFETDCQNQNYRASGKYAEFDFVVDKINYQPSEWLRFNVEVKESNYILANLTKLHPSALDFLRIHGWEANCSSDASSYFVFTHAQQIHKYPEVYTLCGEAFNLKNPDYILTPDYKTLDLQSYLSVPKEPIRASKLPTNNVLESFNLQERTVYRQIINPPAYKKISEDISVLVATLKTSTSNISTLKNAIDQLGDYECVINSISLSARIKILEQLIEDGEDKYIISWLKNTPEVHRESVYNHFYENQRLVVKANNNLSGEDWGEFVLLLTEWGIQFNNPENEKQKILKELNTIPRPTDIKYITLNDYGISNSYKPNDRYNGFHKNNLTSVIQNGKVEIIIVESHITTPPKEPIRTYCTGNPLDYVVLKAGIGFEDFSPHFQQDDRIIVPMIFAHWLIESYNSDRKMARLQLILEAAAIVATMGEASPIVAAIDASISATNIYITINEQALRKTSGGNEFIEVYTSFESMYAYSTMGAGLVKSKYASLVFEDLQERYRNLPNLIKQKQAAKALNNIGDAFINLSKSLANGVQNIVNSGKKFSELAHSFRLVNYTTFSSQGYSALAKWVGNEIKCCVLAGGIYYSIATIRLDAYGDLFFSNVKFYSGKPNAYRLIGNLFDVRYSKNNIEYNGDIALVKAEDGFVYALEQAAEIGGSGNIEVAIEISDYALLLGTDVANAKSYLAGSARPANTIDLAVHGSGETYTIIINGKEYNGNNHRTLAGLIKNNAEYNGKTIRLLSCSSLESAQDLANKTGQNVIACEGEVRLFADGGITNGNTPWYLLQPGNKPRTLVENPRPPNSGVTEFIELGKKKIQGAGNWKPIQKIANKYPTEAMPLDGQLWGIAEIESGAIKQISNKGNTFNDVDFVITTSGELKIGKRHHFLGNASDVEAAGTIKTVNGKIKKISNSSGHYFPTIDETNKFPEIFRQLGLDTKGASLEIKYLDEAGNLKTQTKFINE
nr:fibronectin type III domain-containing protein [Cytophagaceae bacterium]